jgi:hypothetical protein
MKELEYYEIIRLISLGWRRKASDEKFSWIHPEGKCFQENFFWSLDDAIGEYYEDIYVTELHVSLSLKLAEEFLKNKEVKGQDLTLDCRFNSDKAFNKDHHYLEVFMADDFQKYYDFFVKKDDTFTIPSKYSSLAKKYIRHIKIW